MITQVTLGKTYEVCCPGTAQSIGDIQYCCVGGNEKQEKRDVCFPWCFSTGDSSTSTDSCVTKVPVTAADFSERVSSTTATVTTAPTTTATTTASSATSTDSKPSSNGGSAQMTTMALAVAGFSPVMGIIGLLL